MSKPEKELPDRTDDEAIASYSGFMKMAKGIPGTVSCGDETVHTDDIVGDMLSDMRVRAMFLKVHRNGEAALREWNKETDEEVN